MRLKHTTTYRQKDNGWQIIISWKDSNGKWKQRSKQGFAKKCDAKDYEAELLEKIKKQPCPVDRSMANITLVQFCEEYIKLKKMLHSHAQAFRNSVSKLGPIAKKPIRCITYLELQSVISDWDLAPATQETYRRQLNALFRNAVKPYRIIADNPMEDVITEKNRDRQERLTITELEFEKLLRITPTPHSRLAAAICYYTGCRRSELLGLTWDDVDWKNMTVNIDKQYTRSHTGSYENVPPKSKNGFRIVPIPVRLIQMLKEFHSAAPLRLDKKILFRPHGAYRALHASLKKINKDLSPHCLRHTYATRLLAEGLDVQTVAALIGDDVKTVINIYIHYSDDMRKAAARNIRKIFA